jgi:hypothetical protein
MSSNELKSSRDDESDDEKEESSHSGNRSERSSSDNHNSMLDRASAYNSGSAAAAMSNNEKVTESDETQAAMSESDKMLNTVGFHQVGSLGENIDLPEYVREHNNTLSFPEKVRYCELRYSCTNPSRQFSKQCNCLSLGFAFCSR